jgi:hypothetical protein
MMQFYFFLFCVYETITFIAFLKCRHNRWIFKFSWGNHVAKFRRFIFLYPLHVSLCMSKNHYWVKDHLNLDVLGWIKMNPCIFVAFLKLWGGNKILLIERTELSVSLPRTTIYTLILTVKRISYSPNKFKTTNKPREKIILSIKDNFVYFFLRRAKTLMYYYNPR